MRYILRSGFAGLFLLDTWKRGGTLTVNEGFKTAEYPLYEATFNFHFMGQKLRPSDVENPELTSAEPPMVRIMSAVNYEGIQRGGKNARPLNVLNIANVQGANVWAWAEFVRLIKACNVDLKSPGKAKPLPDGLKTVAFRVDALEGRAQWEAKNVVRAWHATMEQFQKEDETAAQALETAVSGANEEASAPGAEGHFSLSDDEGGGMPGVSMSLSDEAPPTMPETPATHAAPTHTAPTGEKRPRK